MNHFTNLTPDVETVKHFYINFLGGVWYSENFRLHQVLLGGILIDCFPPGDETPEGREPEPGHLLQRYRFSIDPEHVGDWIAHAEDWRVRAQMIVEEPIKRLNLVVDTPNGYHIALSATYPTVEALDEAVEEFGGRARKLSEITEPFTMRSGPSTAVSP